MICSNNIFRIVRNSSLLVSLFLVMPAGYATQTDFDTNKWCHKRMKSLKTEKQLSLWQQGCKSLRPRIEKLQDFLDAKAELKKYAAICIDGLNFKNCIADVDFDEDGRMDEVYVLREKGKQQPSALFLAFNGSYERFDILIPGRNVVVGDTEKFKIQQLEYWGVRQIQKHSIEIETCRLPRDIRSLQGLSLALKNGTSHTIVKVAGSYFACPSYD